MKESVDFKALSAPSDSLASKHPIDSSEADKYKITGWPLFRRHQHWRFRLVLFDWIKHLLVSLGPHELLFLFDSEQLPPAPQPACCVGDEPS